MKRLLSSIFFILLISLSIAYLVPSFTYKYNDKYYTFKNLPSLGDKSKENLNIEIGPTQRRFKYEVESTNTFSSSKEWGKLVSEDQKNLERRVESFTESKDYEVRVDKNGDKVLYTILTTTDMGVNTDVFTVNNSDFSVSAKETIVPDSANPEDTGSSTNIDLGLKRNDFGIAEINVDTQSSETAQYQVRLPLGFINADKIKTINNRTFSQLTLFVGGKEYSGQFNTNEKYIPTHLTVQGLSGYEDALKVKTFLNSNQFNLGYNIKSINTEEVKNISYKLIGLIIGTILLAILINKLTLGNLSAKKISYIFGTVVIGLAFTKLVNVTITNGYVFALMFATLLTIFSSRALHYLFFAAVLLLIRLLGYLYFIEISWWQILIVIGISIALFTTNYIRKVNPKYVTE